MILVVSLIVLAVALELTISDKCCYCRKRIWMQFQQYGRDYNNYFHWACYMRKVKPAKPAEEG